MTLHFRLSSSKIQRERVSTAVLPHHLTFATPSVNGTKIGVTLRKFKYGVLYSGIPVPTVAIQKTSVPLTPGTVVDVHGNVMRISLEQSSSENTKSETRSRPTPVLIYQLCCSSAAELKGTTATINATSRNAFTDVAPFYRYSLDNFSSMFSRSVKILALRSSQFCSNRCDDPAKNQDITNPRVVP